MRTNDIWGCVILFIMLLPLLALSTRRIVPRRLRLWYCRRLGWHDREGGSRRTEWYNKPMTCSVCGKDMTGG